jgi:hypothetical protein
MSSFILQNLTFLNLKIMTQEENTKFQETWSKIRTIFIVIGVLILVGYLMKSCEAETKLAETQTLNKAMNDTLKTWKDKEGNFKAKITSLETKNVETFTKWKTSNNEVIKLQALVTKYKKQLDKKGSATVITTNADIDISEPTIVYRDTTKPCDPIYETPFEIMGTGKYEKTKWVWGIVTATKDSTRVGMRFHEEIDVVIGQEKTGFLGLGKPRSFAEVTLHNPFNKVLTLRSYSTTPLPAKRFGIGPVVAYGVGYKFAFQFFVGVGINWNLIRI